MNKNLNKKIKGFTLIELLVVISIISLFSSIVLSSLANAREDARISKAQQDLQQIRNAFELYVGANNGEGPDDWEVSNCDQDFDLESYIPSPNGKDVEEYASYLEPYLSEISLDPWGNTYVVDAVYNCDPSSEQDPSNFPIGCERQSQGVYVNALLSKGADGKTFTDDPGSIYDDVILMLCDYNDAD
jgi:type II secretion system protein G